MPHYASRSSRCSSCRAWAWLQSACCWQQAKVARMRRRRDDLRSTSDFKTWWKLSDILGQIYLHLIESVPRYAIWHTVEIPGISWISIWVVPRAWTGRRLWTEIDRVRLIILFCSVSRKQDLAECRTSDWRTTIVTIWCSCLCATLPSPCCSRPMAQHLERIWSYARGSIQLSRVSLSGDLPDERDSGVPLKWKSRVGALATRVFWLW